MPCLSKWIDDHWAILSVRRLVELPIGQKHWLVGKPSVPRKIVMAKIMVV
jgi:hypothetical protein